MAASASAVCSGRSGCCLNLASLFPAPCQAPRTRDRVHTSNDAVLNASGARAAAVHIRWRHVQADRRAAIASMAAAPALLAAAPSKAEYGDGANVFGKMTNTSGARPRKRGARQPTCHCTGLRAPVLSHRWKQRLVSQCWFCQGV